MFVIPGWVLVWGVVQGVPVCAEVAGLCAGILHTQSRAVCLTQVLSAPFTASEEPFT